MLSVEIDEDVSGSDIELFEMPETVLCVDTICNICYAEFLDEEDLKMHVKQMHLTESSRSRYCRFCSTLFPCLEEYARHICEVHILNIKCCKYCMRAFMHLPDVRRHERKHLSISSKSGYKCSNCNVTFEKVNELERHEYMEHKDSKDGVILQECYSLLSSFLNIKASTFLQSLGTHYVYTCVFCKITTPDVEYYMQHLQQKNCRSLVCDKCCNVYRKLVGLQRHFAGHFECHNEVHKDLMLPCKRCNKQFSYELLQEHSKVCQAVKCSTCDIVFETVSERADHQGKAHVTTFSIKICKYCHREFVGQVALEKHIERSHKKDLHLYKYFCIYCKEVFNHPKRLFSHFFGKHKELKPFTCKICNKTFRLRKQFTLHIKLDHLSHGTVKFDENFHVIFTDKEPTSKNKEIDDVKDTNQSDTNVEDMEDNSQSLLVPRKKSIDVLGDVELVMCQTETEQEQTDIDKTKTKKTFKRKRKNKSKNPTEYIDLTNAKSDSDDGSDDEPLIKVKRRVKARQLEKIFTCDKKSKEMKRNRRKFTCKICKKYCYTYQNYNHHMSLHQKHEYKKCIKCTKVFKSKDKLNNHILKEHSSSKLTETLKNVLERRKHVQPSNNTSRASELCRKIISQRFLNTIKRSNTDTSDAVVTVTPVSKLSVKKFIEDFIPESNEGNGKKRTMNIKNIVTIKSVNKPLKKPIIKLVKSSETVSKFVKLKQPEKFKDTNTEQYVVSIKPVYGDANRKMCFDPPEEITPVQEYEENEEVFLDEDSYGPTIPEVAEEVMLEETIEPANSKEIFHNLVIPNLPKEYKDVHIAHLLPEAPFYRIVKIDEVLKEQATKEQAKESGNIKLPDGTKLISVNPLAHLLGDKQLGMPRKKYYKPKQVDFEKAVAKAMINSKKTFRVKRKRKIRVETEQ
ncbi:zinc finger protein 493-like [Battus philenor]|uniref:zinc finger protein 493-like n=1 Tax=Battus philenor TaxID=42288 RepID=UPI0035D05B65